MTSRHPAPTYLLVRSLDRLDFLGTFPNLDPAKIQKVVRCFLRLGSTLEDGFLIFSKEANPIIDIASVFNLPINLEDIAEESRAKLGNQFLGTVLPIPEAA